MATAAGTTPAKKKEAKPIFPIFFTIVSDGSIPGKNNLLHVSAQYEEIKWARNIQPQAGPPTASRRVPQDLLDKVSEGAIPMRQAMQELETWLNRFKGERVAVTSAVAFWHILFHMSAYVTNLPFTTAPIDVSSYLAGKRGELTFKYIVKGKDPEKVMEDRIAVVTGVKSPGGVKRDWEW